VISAEEARTISYRESEQIMIDRLIREACDRRETYITLPPFEEEDTFTLLVLYGYTISLGPKVSWGKK